MSELATDVHSFNDFLLTESLEDARKVCVDTLFLNPELQEVDVRNAFHFMQDVELYEMLWVDDVVLNPDSFEPDDLDDIREGNRDYAKAIDFIKGQLKLGNVTIIKTLSHFEQAHNNKYGVIPYTDQDMWDGELKAQSFHDFMFPKVPDSAPED